MEIMIQKFLLIIEFYFTSVKNKRNYCKMRRGIRRGVRRGTRRGV